MRKAPEAFRTISEAADALDTPAHVLRFWESKFSQVKPVKRAGGRRYYRPTDIDLLSGIRLLLHDQGMTIRGVQKLLQEKGARHVAALAPLTGEALEGRAEPVLDIAADMTTADIAATRSRERSSPKPMTKPDEVRDTPPEPALHTSAPQTDVASIQDATATGETPSTSSPGTAAPTVQRPDRITAAAASTEQSAGRRPEDDAPDLAKTEGDHTEKPSANADDTPSAEGAASEAPRSEHAPNLGTEAVDAPAAPEDPSDEDATVPADASESGPSPEERPAPALGPLLESAADTTTETPRFARIAQALRSSPPRSMAVYAPATARLEALVAKMSARAD